MAYFMGIDIETSSLKTIIIDESGFIKALSSQSYQYDSPEEGYAEQDPEVCERLYHDNQDTLNKVEFRAMTLRLLAFPDRCTAWYCLTKMEKWFVLPYYIVMCGRESRFSRLMKVSA